MAVPSSHSPSPRRKRSIRRRITCPLHPEQRLMSSSAKVWLQTAPDGSLRATKPWSQQPAAVRQALRKKPCQMKVQRWLERFHCQQCGEQRWWQIAFQPPSTYSVSLPEKQFRRAMAGDRR